MGVHISGGKWIIHSLNLVVENIVLALQHLIMAAENLKGTFYGECRLCECSFMGSSNHLCGCGHDFDVHVSKQPGT